MNQTGDTRCSRCGEGIPPDASEGLCPRCLLALNLETRTKSSGDTAAPSAGAAPLPAELAALAKLFPQLELLECLGRGGMGVVYKARQPRLDRLAALKLLRRGQENDPRFAERFAREAQTLARLSHPNIVAIYDFGETGGQFYLLMEYVDGLSLRQLLHAGKLKPAQALTIVPPICDALQYAHEQGIVHRDIKPENILLDKQGRVKIADFGIAKLLGTGGGALTGARDVIGTPHYMAPEQIEKPQEVDHRADIYSLGVVFYEMLTGELPLGRFQPPSSCAPGVQLDVRLDAVVLRALEKLPERRYQHAGQVKTEVETINSSVASSAAPPRPRSGVRSGLLAAMAVALLALVLVVGLYFRQGRPAGKSGLSAGNAAPAVSATSLRYRWKPGETYVYSIRLEATAEDYIETVAGNVSYTVRSVEGDRATLFYTSHLGPPMRRPKPGRNLPVSFPFSLADFWSRAPFEPSTRELQVDSRGGILSQTGVSHPLPQALGDVEALVFEPFPAQAQPAWDIERDCEVVLTTVEPVSPMSHFGRTQKRTLAARETAAYHIDSGVGNPTLVKKRYELKTQETVAGEPRLQLAGDGSFAFDAALGLPRVVEFTGTLTERTENSSLRTPLSLRCTLLDGAERVAALQPPPPAKDEPKELTASALREILADLRSPDAVRRSIALGKLAEARPAAPSEDAAKLLIAALDAPDWATRQNAARALGFWGTTNAVAPLLKTLEDAEFSVRWAAIGALARLKAPQAAAPLAKHLAVETDSLQAAQALKALGPLAEDAVIERLTDKDLEARRAACRILDEIGSQKSVPALTGTASDADSITAMLAEAALRAIEARRQSGGGSQPPAENTDQK